MKVSSFRRGIHPPDSKNTAGIAISMIYPAEGEEMVYSMQQHIGAPCKPIVQAGERVLMGQKIGDTDAFVSSPVHSSVSGTVKGFIDTLLPTGQSAQAIVIINDGKYEEVPEMLSRHPENSAGREGYEKLPREEVLKIIREAGIVGMGGAGFPAHIKLNPPKDKKIDYIIINASECEPFLTSDHRVMLEETDRFVNGIKIVLRLFPGAKAIIGIELNKPDAIETVSKAVSGESDIEIVLLKPKYPQGSEKQLIQACTGRMVPSGGLPADAGCIVNNVDTIIAIERAVKRARPLMRRIITITGGAAAKPGNYKALIGMSYTSLLKAAGGYSVPPAKLISGGPMMGVALFDTDIPVIKTSSALICMTEKEAYLPPEQNCFRCGKCVAACPIGLMPLELNQYALSNDDAGFEKNHGMDCVECGSCSYVCPAKRHLAQSMRSTRRRLLASKRK